MLSAELKERFEQDGFVVLPSFISESEAEELNVECRKLVEKMDLSEHKTVFSSTHTDMVSSDDYFLNSGDKIRFFFETEALDDDGNLKLDKHLGLNKIGHALHWWSPAFKKLTFSSKVKDTLKCLKMVDPVVIHSMYIFKNANIGGEVPVQRRMIRSYEDDSGKCKLVFTGPKEKYDESKFVPIPVQKGDLILIHSKVVHKSAANRSNKPRPCYTFHVADKSQTKFDKFNWIQPTEQLPFTPIYDEC